MALTEARFDHDYMGPVDDPEFGLSAMFLAGMTDAPGENYDRMMVRTLGIGHSVLRVHRAAAALGETVVDAAGQGEVTEPVLVGA